jgi:hypothetical protein
MRKVFFIMAILGCLVSFTSCNDYETYGEKKDKERAAIRNFIAEQGINVISEADFHAQGDMTDTAKNEYVYLNNDGVYMQIVHKGYGTPVQNNERVTLLMRFFEMCIMDSTQVYNDTDPYDPDYMVVQRTGTSYSAYFLSGSLMYSTYGTSSVAAGLLSPLPFVITSYNLRFGWVCSSSNMTPLVLKPCLFATSAESTLYLLLVGL